MAPHALTAKLDNESARRTANRGGVSGTRRRKNIEQSLLRILLLVLLSIQERQWVEILPEMLDDIPVESGGIDLCLQVASPRWGARRQCATCRPGAKATKKGAGIRPAALSML